MPSSEWFLLEGEDLSTNSEYLDVNYMKNLFLVSDVNDWRKYLFENIEKFIIKNMTISESSKNISNYFYLF
jgi:hypothetical protein